MAAMADIDGKMAAMTTEETAAAVEAAAAKKRDKKKRAKANKKKGEGGGAEEEGGDDAEDAEPSVEAEVGGGGGAAEGKFTAATSKEELLMNLLSGRRKREAEDAATKSHKFWDTQPVPKIGDAVTECGPLVLQTVDEIRTEPYPMAAGMEWSLVNINDAAQCNEVYTLLTENYVEDDDAMFRFDYAMPFLLWALTPPGYLPDLHLGVRSSKSGRLMAFISGVPATMRVHGAKVPMVEINFLCVHKKLRAKRLAPVLIKEITRRVNVTGVFQAVYTAGVVLPSPVGQCRYWHRSINFKKLVDVGFSRVGERSTMARSMKLYKLEDKTKFGIVPMAPKHVKSACKLLNDYLTKFKLAPEMCEAEFGHMLLPRKGVIDAFVLADPTTGAVTDLCSFYHLPSSVMKHATEPNCKLFAAYSFYNVATTVPLKELMGDALILAKAAGVDVFNALDLMDNAAFLKDLKFGPGDGNLQYYLYNYKAPMMPAADIGLVLL